MPLDIALVTTLRDINVSHVLTIAYWNCRIYYIMFCCSSERNAEPVASLDSWIAPSPVELLG